ncbi:Uncharacterised protein [Vibrio cholerae]|uniref:Uncharacterized protein n=1 Tax=Vibrio cholerae TaxID=666 RepID=A0A656AJR9_VIBCL|nr:Uncharacterised protein [Vibrio cholerae]CSD14953.1 Uncharacterised protein [Vibrio cholerae]
MLTHQWHSITHNTCRFRWIIDGDAVMLTSGFTQGIGNEFIQRAEIRFTLFWPCQHNRHWLIGVFWVHHNAQDIQ